MKKVMIWLTLTLMVSSGWAQTKTSFTYRYEPGQTYRYLMVADIRMVMDMSGRTFETTSTGRMLISLKAVERNSDGDLSFEAWYDSLTISIKSMQMDTTMVLSDLLGKRAKLVINQYGRTKSLTAIDSLNSNPMVQRILNSDPHIYLRRLLSDLPDQPMAIGDKWTNTQKDTTKQANMQIVVEPAIEYTLTGTEAVDGEPCSRFTLVGPLSLTGKGNQMGADFFIEGDGTSNGFLLYNEKRGILAAVEGSTEQVTSIAISGGANMTMSQTQTMRHKLNLLP
ncbi:MAG: hypothetical protein BWY83_02819 [bacterium ADurb.Bin478]|nr:MAG: hypothetical protein BWY83_02819 [bacterium ADurb.Bin478]